MYAVVTSFDAVTFSLRSVLSPLIAVLIQFYAVPFSSVHVALSAVLFPLYTVSRDYQGKRVNPPYRSSN